MTSIEVIKRNIKAIYQNDPHIHITAVINKEKLIDTPAVIEEVYPNIFRIEENSTGIPQHHILQYTDILIGQIKISELNMQAESPQ